LHIGADHERVACDLKLEVDRAHRLKGLPVLFLSTGGSFPKKIDNWKQ